MAEKVTADVILGHLKKFVEDKIPLAPHRWIDAAAQLNVLVGEETSRLFYLKQAVARAKMERINAGDNVSKAKSFIETTDEYRDMKILEGKIKLIEENIRISKLMARTAIEEIRGN